MNAFGLAGLLRAHVRRKVEIPHCGADSACEPADVERIDRRHAAPSRDDILPGFSDRMPYGSYQTEPGDDDSAHQEITLGGSTGSPRAISGIASVPRYVRCSGATAGRLLGVRGDVVDSLLHSGDFPPLPRPVSRS